MKMVLQIILSSLARATIWRYRPLIVGITGSVGKTSTKEAVFAVLRKKYNVRRPEKNYNNEIGLPLTILGIQHPGRNLFKWGVSLLKFLWQIVFDSKNYPEVLVLEYGVDRPGDMSYLLKIVKPKIAVVTAIGETPVHVEFFSGPQEVAEEKSRLVSGLGKEYYVVLNQDEPLVLAMKEKSLGDVLTYGFDKGADFSLESFELRCGKDENLGDIPEGVSFKIAHRGHVVPIRLFNCFGTPPVYAAAAAAAVGVILGMNMVEISEALKEFVSPAGRLRLIKGIKNSFILDDTYNASPASTAAALATLKSLPGKRKIAILGDMLELGNFSEKAHRAMGESAAEICDLFIAVGLRAKFMAEEFSAKKPQQEPEKNLYIFENSMEVAKLLDPLIEKGDLILVKGSQGMRMEKIVEDIMARPEDAPNLLVRQEGYWRK